MIPLRNLGEAIPTQRAIENLVHDDNQHDGDGRDDKGHLHTQQGVVVPQVDGRCPTGCPVDAPTQRDGQRPMNDGAHTTAVPKKR